MFVWLFSIHLILFGNLYRIFLSVIDVIKFDKRKLVLNSGKSPSFANSINFSQWSSRVSVSVFLPRKCPHELYLFLFGKKHLRYGLISLSNLILSGLILSLDCVVLCVALGPSAQRKSCRIFFFFSSHSVAVIVSFPISGPISISCFVLASYLNRSNYCR